MNFKEQLDVINSVPKTELASALNISRQMLYIKIKNKIDIDKIYEAALEIKKFSIETIESYKKEIIELKKQIIQLENKLEKKNREIAEYKKKTNYKELKEALDTLQRKYLNLRVRYTLQNDELCSLKVLLSKERGKEDDIERS